MAGISPGSGNDDPVYLEATLGTLDSILHYDTIAQLAMGLVPKKLLLRTLDFALKRRDQ